MALPTKQDLLTGSWSADGSPYVKVDLSSNIYTGEVSKDGSRWGGTIWSSENNLLPIFIGNVRGSLMYLGNIPILIDKIRLGDLELV